MKIHRSIAFVVLALLVAATPFLRSADTKAEDMINHAYSVIMTPSSPTDAIMLALSEILDASLLILPKTDYSEEYRTRVEVAKKTFADRSLFNDKSHQYLGLAYKLVTGGQAWKVPEELTSAYREKDIMAQAKKICQRSIDSALAELRAGRNERSIRHLLEFVLMVITPIEA